jgi:hypothetical protein
VAAAGEALRDGVAGEVTLESPALEPRECQRAWPSLPPSCGLWRPDDISWTQVGGAGSVSSLLG